MRASLLAFACFVLLLPVTGCGCDEDPPLGDPYLCGTTMSGTECRTGQACIENDGARDGTWACAPDRGCTMGVIVRDAYCPEATGSVFCTEDQPFMLTVPTDGPGMIMQTKVLCQY
jgi:hypothetical protein